MFIGNYSSKLDTAKGRTAIPVTFRRQLGKRAVITQGYEKSLMIVRADQWEQVVGQVANVSFLSGVARQTERFLLGSAFTIEMDTQGRFIIPQALRRFAALGKEIVFVGIGNRIEIWAQKGWKKQQEHLTENIALISEKLDEKITQGKKQVS